MEEVSSKAVGISSIEIVESHLLASSVISAKSLVWIDDAALPYMLILTIDRRVCDDKLAAALNKKLRMTDREAAEAITQQRVGVISPIRQSHIRIIVDSSLLLVAGTDQRIAVGCGIEGSSYCLTVEQLISWTSAEIHDISTDDQYMKAKALILPKKPVAHLSKSDFSGLRFSPQLLRKLAISSDTVKLIATIEAGKRGTFSSEHLFPKHFTMKEYLNLPSKVGGKTPLHLAAWKGPLESVRVLIENGASVNQYSTNIGNYGKTALFYAVTQCRDDVVLELLKHDASVIIVNNKGQTPRSLAASHLKEETIAAIEDAEKRQLALANEFLNFYVTHRDHEGSYGDLDPRFADEGKELREQMSADQLPRSILATTVTTRRGKNVISSATSKPEDFLSTFSPHFAEYPNEGRTANVSNIIHPVVHTAMELKAMVIAKRQISKYLVFVNICPIAWSDFQSFLGMRFSWQDDIGSNDMYSIQLIVGKTLKSILGQDLLSSLCKYIREGQKIYVRGEIRAITLGKRPLPSQVLYSNEKFAKAETLREIDLAVSQILFLDETTTSSGESASCEGSVGSQSITTSSSTSAIMEAMRRMKQNETILHEPDDDGVFEDGDGWENGNDTFEGFDISGQKMEGEEIIYENEQAERTDTAVSIPVLPVLKLDDFVTSLQVFSAEDAASTFSFTATITLVNDGASLQQFESTIHRLISLANDNQHFLPLCPTAVMGIDCEWRPEGRYRNNGNDNNGDDDNTDESNPIYHYVETFQIGTKLGIYVLDMTVLTQEVDLVSTLNQVLHLAFENERVWKIGYDCRQDFERLAASFPQCSCFTRVLTIIDLQSLARQLYPGRVLKKHAGLSRLCGVLLGRGLDKTQQCSPWHIRPLTVAQIEYAALDVASLIMLLDKMVIDFHVGTPFRKKSKRKNKKNKKRREEVSETEVKEEEAEEAKEEEEEEEESFFSALKRLSMVFNVKFTVQDTDQAFRNNLNERTMKQHNMLLMFSRLLCFKKWSGHGVEPFIPSV